MPQVEFKQVPPMLPSFARAGQMAGAGVRFNFGPDFKHPPPVLEGCPPAQPLCQLVKQYADGALEQAEGAQAMQE